MTVASTSWPSVAVVMPIRNERRDLAAAVASVLQQSYPGPFQLCLAVAPSDDGTEALAEALAAGDPRVVTVANPPGTIPAGLNAAIAATDSHVVVRVDGHAELSPGYIERAVAELERTGAVNVGGRQVPASGNPFGAAVAAATVSLLGTGGARYRIGGEAGPVDTVFLGVVRRSAGAAVGWFNETLLRNEDYEFNIRLRKAGGTVWFDPELSATYRPRESVRALARQYHDYGIWKAEVVRLHPGSLRARQMVPAAMPVAVTGCAVASPACAVLGLVPLAYVALVVATSARVSRTSTARFTDLVRIYPTMHWAWGLGALRGAARVLLRRNG